MNKRIFSYAILFLLFLSMIPLFSPSVTAPNTYGNWIIDGNKVYVDDSLVYASATPHTIFGGGDVVFEFKSKVFTGDVDFCWGFDQGIIKPTAIWLWQNYSHSFYTQVLQQDWGSVTLNNVTSYTSLGIENYSNYVVTLGNENNTYLYLVNYNINSSGIYAFTTFSNVGSTYTLSGNYYHFVDKLNTVSYFDWNPWDVTYNHIQWNYEGMTDWYLTTPQGIVADATYKCKIRLEQQHYGLEAMSGKYWFAFKPTSETLSDAITNNHFYCLDPWWNTSFAYSKKITIDHTKVAGALTNFPVLINITDADVKAHAQADGDDICFVNSANTTKYNHEIESYVTATGALVAWVNVTSLSSVDDTILWMYYGNASCTSQQNKNGVWDKHYKAVWHMNDLATSTIADSTQYKINSTKKAANEPIQAAAKIGNGQDYDGSNDYINHTTGLLLSGAASISFWIYYQNNSYGTDRIILAKRNGGTGTNYQFSAYTDGKLYFYNGSTSSGTYKIPVNSWVYLTIVRTAANEMKLYANGSYVSTWAKDWGTTGNTAPLISGSLYPVSNFLDMKMDELRISNVTRSATWITTEYNNQNSPSTFMTFGSQISAEAEITGLVVTWFNSTKISLAWNKGSGSTVLVRNATAYPSAPDKGVKIYNSTLEVFADTGLSSSHKYYYRAWNWNGTAYGTVNTSANGTTRPKQPTNPTYQGLTTTSVNISWTKGLNATKTVIRKSTTTQPLLPTDGTELYNGTASYKIDNAVTGTFYDTLFAYNTTTGLFSSPGVNLSTYFVWINCYNESSGLAISDYNVFFTNPLGTQTFANDSCNNPFLINTTDIPQGNDISLLVNAFGYYARTYVMDIVITGNYYINAYLVPITASLYNLRVVETVETNYVPVDQAVEDALVTVKRYINASAGYQTVSSLLTDANGYVNLQLVPYVQYKVFLNKTGYENATSDYIPAPPNAFGQTAEKVFRLVLISSNATPPPVYLWDDYITFTGSMNNATSIIYVNYTDALTNTTDWQLFIYRIDPNSTTPILIASWSGTNDSFALSAVVPGTTSDYKVVFHVNHTNFDYQVRELYFYGYHAKLTSATRFNLLFTLNYGYNPFGWANTFMFFVILGCFFSFGRKETYMSVFAIGIILLFFNIYVGLNTVWTAIAGGFFPILLIFFGILMLVRDRGYAGVS